MAWSVAWMLEHAENTEKEVEAYTQLGATLKQQGSDWDSWFESCGEPNGCKGGAGGHNVNNAQALKSSAVWYRFNNNATMRRYAKVSMLHSLTHSRTPSIHPCMLP